MRSGLGTRSGISPGLGRGIGGVGYAPSLRRISSLYLWYSPWGASNGFDGSNLLTTATDRSGHGRDSATSPIANRLSTVADTTFPRLGKAWSGTGAQFLDTPALSFSNPFAIWVVCKVTDANPSFKFACDGVLSGQRCALFGSDATHTEAFSAQGDAALIAATALNQTLALLFESNGTSTKLWINGVSAATGNWTHTTLTGLRFFGRYDSTSSPNGKLYDCAMFNGALSASDRAYLFSTYGHYWFPSLL